MSFNIFKILYKRSCVLIKKIAIPQKILKIIIINENHIKWVSMKVVNDFFNKTKIIIKVAYIPAL